MKKKLNYDFSEDTKQNLCVYILVLLLNDYIIGYNYCTQFFYVIIVIDLKMSLAL